MPPVVFVTAYDQFAIRAFEAHALDYLVKPLNRSRFDLAIARIRERRELIGARDLAARAQHVACERRGRSCVAVTAHRCAPFRRGAHAGGRRHRLDRGRRLCRRVYAGGERHLLRESLASLECRLDLARFVRVHRSAIVCIERVARVCALTPAVT